MEEKYNHIQTDIEAVSASSSECLSTSSTAGDYKAIDKISADYNLNDLDLQEENGPFSGGIADASLDCLNTNAFADKGSIDSIIFKEYFSKSGLSNSLSELRDYIFYFENTINHHLNDLKINSSWSKYYDYDGRSRLNSVLDSKVRLNRRWDKIELLYEEFKHNYHELLHEYLDEYLLKFIKFEHIIDPFQNYFNKVKNKFSQFVEYTNKLSKLLFESVDVEDQRFVFRTIYGFIFKNLDDESVSDRQEEDVRKRPVTAFINYSHNFNSIGSHYEEQRINSGFKKDLRR
ncbi:MAG: hypothetical protein U5K69_01040 [Balneolaceae bacterium]|nr:hypothetical protein [Balneolaceae bacterium]